MRGIDKDDVERGQVLCKPGSVKPHTKFKAEAYILTKEEGGRHTPFFTNYRPQFYFRTTDVTGVVTLAGRHRDGDAGRQHRDGGDVDRADRDGGEASLRHPRGRPHGWRRRRRKHHRVIVTTTNDVAGYRVTQHLGVVRGMTVRSRSIIGNIGAGIQSLFGGNISIYTELAERRARKRST